MKSLFFIFFLLISQASIAQSISSELREKDHHTALIGYELISTWLPFKFTGSYTYHQNQKWSFEAEMGRGYFGTGYLGTDLASVSEYRYSLLARRYTGNSFHTIFGVYKDDFKAKLGSDMLSGVSDTSEIKVKVVGVTLGLGNRWQWENGLTMGLDWIRMNVPLIDKQIDDDALDNVVNDSDRETIEEGIRKVSNVPTFVLFGFYLGYSF